MLGLSPEHPLFVANSYFSTGDNALLTITLPASRLSGAANSEVDNELLINDCYHSATTSNSLEGLIVFRNIIHRSTKFSFMIAQLHISHSKTIWISNKKFSDQWPLKSDDIEAFSTSPHDRQLHHIITLHRLQFTGARERIFSCVIKQSWSHT